MYKMWEKKSKLGGGFRNQKYIGDVLMDNTGGYIHLTQWNRSIQNIDEIILDREQIELLHQELGEILSKDII